ncbi:MAG: T9SS type A sorting domain-containing protein [Candidatus Marinimicrobia bacterium]|nr:T9SS type A sorting domain-containing protein [Candidatus Neomarinimicrobiota bacterium]
MLAIVSVASLTAETLKVAIIRVSFISDLSPATTGDGTFVLDDTLDLECTDWTLDPPPHGKTYFSDHLIAMDNYWQRVTNGAVSVDLVNSAVFPDTENGAYQLQNDMLYYHPYLEDFDETAKLFELSRHALELADPDVNFNNYSTVILVHAGMGGDFAFALDPTPGNIPSAYLSLSDFNQFGLLETDEGALTDLIIVPESQNFLQYKETRELFAESDDPCFYQVALNGTLALMLGFHLGLPPLYNTETGRSLAGGFALMDQGSNNFHGIVPAFPDPYSRIEAGWVGYAEKGIGDSVNLGIGDPPIRISITDTEYYLIENRQRNLLHPSSLPLWIDSPGFDTVSVVLSPGGVVLSVDEQDSGLPGNGLHIWHIDESAWNNVENPNGGPIQMVDFVEADGAQDMGYTTQLLFADYLETGWWFDTWFAGNQGWFHLNQNAAVIGDSLLSFSSNSHPSTRSNSGTPSHLRLENISKNGAVMTFNINSDRWLDRDKISSIIGWGSGQNYLWAFSPDSSQILSCTLVSGQLSCVVNPIVSPALIFQNSVDSLINFRHPWLITKVPTAIRFLNIETGAVHFDNLNRDPYEISVNNDQVTYFSKRYLPTDTLTYITYWNSSTNTSTNVPLLGDPLARFTSTSGTSLFYGAEDKSSPTPVGVAAQANYPANTSAPEKLDVISWSSSENKLMISHLPGDEHYFLDVNKPSHIVALDADLDGSYEIALFYSDHVNIMNQAGIVWNGNPFTIEPFFGNPILAPLSNAGLGIFLRHNEKYAVYSLTGQLMDSGVLSTPHVDIVNTLGFFSENYVLQSGDVLLNFSKLANSQNQSSWSDPQGRAEGDRMVVLVGDPIVDSPKIKPGSAYNYPNPVKGSTTTIRTWLGDVDTWTIEIFSLSGAQVTFSEQVVSQQNAYNEWIWDASSFSNGVYLAQLSAGNATEIIKIAIIR